MRLLITHPTRMEDKDVKSIRSLDPFLLLLPTVKVDGIVALILPSRKEYTEWPDQECKDVMMEQVSKSCCVKSVVSGPLSTARLTSGLGCSGQVGSLLPMCPTS
jgi:hypothetical protein